MPPEAAARVRTLFVELASKCLAAGMLAHLTKPIDPDTLYAAVRKYAR